jgi:palmitoyl transferase
MASSLYQLRIQDESLMEAPAGGTQNLEGEEQGLLETPEAQEQGLFETPEAQAQNLFEAPEGQEQSLAEVSVAAEVGEEETPGMFGRWTNRMGKTWREGDVTLIVPLYTWHNRFMYKRESVRRFNENPWGGGLGLTMFDEDGDTHILLAMAFLDSWNKVQPYAGYAYLKNWYFGSNDDYRVGLGAVLGITGRDQYNYIPIPLPLPIFGFGYKQFSWEATYIPGEYNKGNALFTWLRWTFN